MSAQPTDPAGVAIPQAASVGSTGGSGEYTGEEESLSLLLRDHIAERVVQPRLDCQIWCGATDRGYGRIYIYGTAARVHRVVWELEHGSIPDGMTVDHICRVRACCNVRHMELVTHPENVKRATRFRPRIRHRAFRGPGRGKRAA